MYWITITLVIFQSISHLNFTFYEGTKVFVIFLEEILYKNTSKFIKEINEYLDELEGSIATNNTSVRRNEVHEEKVKEIKL